ncbi:MAG: hypothetical protein U9P72_08295 [Campylobacterota bacterium]|nr:hypothetical protein [Campylobacterota bacterium]
MNTQTTQNFTSNELTKVFNHFLNQNNQNSYSWNLSTDKKAIIGTKKLYVAELRDGSFKSKIKERMYKIVRTPRNTNVSFFAERILTVIS